MSTWKEPIIYGGGRARRTTTLQRPEAEGALLNGDSSGKSDLNWLTGGLAVDDSVPARSLATLKVQLAQELKLFGLKFKQMEERREKRI